MTTIDRANELDATYRCDTCNGRGLRACDHVTDLVNEYGDCYDCDGEGTVTCECQE